MSIKYERIQSAVISPPRTKKELKDLLVNRGDLFVAEDGSDFLHFNFHINDFEPVRPHDVPTNSQNQSTESFNIFRKMLSYYTFDDTSNLENDDLGDASLTLSNISTASETDAKLGKSAAQFTGNNSSITVPSNAFPSSGSDFTISFWYQPTSFGSEQNIFRTADGSTTTVPFHIKQNSDGTIGTTLNEITPMVNSTTTLNPGTWAHIVITHTNKKLRIYINGQYDDAEKDFPSSDPFGVDTVEFTGPSSNEIIDEVGIWATVLDAIEIEWLYNSGDGTHQFLEQLWHNYPAQNKVNMKQHPIDELPLPSTKTEALSRQYWEDGNVAADIDMNFHKIGGVALDTGDNTAAITRKYLENGNVQGELDMTQQRIKNVALARKGNAEAATAEYIHITESLLDGLYSYYTFENGDLNDDFGTHSATLDNSASLTSNGGKIGSYRIKSSSEGETLTIPAPGTSVFSISFWTWVSSSEEKLYALVQGNKFAFTMWINKTELYTDSNESYDISDYIIPKDQWIHAVVRGDDNNNLLELHVNGQNVHNHPFESGTIGSPSIFQFGLTNAPWPGYHNQTPSIQFDEIGVWDRLLTPQEITFLYNGDNGRNDFLPKWYQYAAHTDLDLNGYQVANAAFPQAKSNMVTRQYLLSEQALSNDVFAYFPMEGSSLTPDSALRNKMGLSNHLQAEDTNLLSTSPLTFLSGTGAVLFDVDQSYSVFSISFWYYPRSGSGSTDASVFECGNVTVSHSGSNQLAVTIDSTTQSGTSNFSNDQWHHIAVGIDGKDVKVYIDGSTDINLSYSTTSSISGTAKIGKGLENDERIKHFAIWTDKKMDKNNALYLLGDPSSSSPQTGFFAHVDWYRIAATEGVNLNGKHIKNLNNPSQGDHAVTLSHLNSNHHDKSTADNRFLRTDGNNSMSAGLNMNGNTIVNVEGTSDSKFDVANKEYVQNYVSNNAGDSSDWATHQATENVDMNGNRVVGLPYTGLGDDHAVNLGYLQSNHYTKNTSDQRFLRLDGNNSMDDNLDMNGKKIVNVGGTGGNTDDEVATKGYVQENAGKSVFYNVKDNGAVGNGSNDDTSAFDTTVSNAASNGGGTVYVPPGEYVLDNFRISSDNITLLGDGSASVLRLKNKDYGTLSEDSTSSSDTAATVRVLNSAARVSNVIVRSLHFTFDQTTLANQNNYSIKYMAAIYFANCDASHVIDCSVESSPGSNITLTYCNKCSIRNINIKNPSSGPTEVGVSLGGTSSECVINTANISGMGDSIHTKDNVTDITLDNITATGTDAGDGFLSISGVGILCSNLFMNGTNPRFQSCKEVRVSNFRVISKFNGILVDDAEDVVLSNGYARTTSQDSGGIYGNYGVYIRHANKVVLSGITAYAPSTQSGTVFKIGRDFNGNAGSYGHTNASQVILTGCYGANKDVGSEASNIKIPTDANFL